jgi:hypothetical protein
MCRKGTESGRVSHVRSCDGEVLVFSVPSSSEQTNHFCAREVRVKVHDEHGVRRRSDAERLRCALGSKTDTLAKAVVGDWWGGGLVLAACIVVYSHQGVAERTRCARMAETQRWYLGRSAGGTARARWGQGWPEALRSASPTRCKQASHKTFSQSASQLLTLTIENGS